MKERNVLVTTIYALDTEKTLQYCVANHAGWRRQYCNAVIPAECCVKHLLSSTPMDEIIVLGSGGADTGDDEITITVKDTDYILHKDISVMTKFEYFCYRISQFLHNRDLFQESLLNSISPDRKEKLEKIINAIFTETSDQGANFGLERLYDMLDSREELHNKALDIIYEQYGLGVDEAEWIRCRIFSLMTDSLKAFAIDDNLNLKIHYIMPSSEIIASTDNINKIMQAIMGEKDPSDQVHVYADFESLNTTDTYSLLNLFKMLENTYRNQFIVESLFSINYDMIDRGRSVVLYDWKNRYDISSLLSALDAFISYGKADPIDEYMKKHGDGNPYVENVVRSMKSVDAGISLCDITEIELGISSLKVALADFEKNYPDDGAGFDMKIFTILINGLMDDYGEILEEDNPSLLSLLKWCRRKKLYQQSLTLIESRLPDELSKTGILYFCRTEDECEHLFESLIPEYNDCPPQNRYQFNDMQHYMMKFYCRGKMRKGSKDARAADYALFMKERLLKGRDENYIPNYSYLFRRPESGSFPFLYAYSLLSDTGLVQDILLTYYTIGNLRNQINHATVDDEPDFSDTREKGESPRLFRSIQLIDHFIRIFDKALQEVKDREFESYQIDSKLFQNYMHKSEKRKT